MVSERCAGSCKRQQCSWCSQSMPEASSAASQTSDAAKQNLHVALGGGRGARQKV